MSTDPHPSPALRSDDTPIVKDLVLVGGGHTHVEVLKRFGMRPLPGARLTMICRDALTPYSGMLPGLIAGHYDFDQVHIDLRPLCGFAGARLYVDEVIGLDLEHRKVLCRSRPPVPYDVVSVNVGSAPATRSVPGADEYAVPVKPIHRFVAHWERMRERVLARSGGIRIGVVGGGAGGVELLLAIQHALSALVDGRGSADLEYHLITDQSDILTTHNRRVAAKFRRILAERGVVLHLEFRVESVAAGLLHGPAGNTVALDEILWVTEAGAARWVGGSGLAVDLNGFMRVAPTLESTSHPGVFGAGDIAAVDQHPRPKSGVFAVRQGRPLASNLRSALRGRSRRPFQPQRQFLSLISTGDRYAVASRSWWTAEGRWVWRWKDSIDRRFMARYADLPRMPERAQAAPAAGLAEPKVLEELSTAMRCGGCGAKVGATVLARAIRRLAPAERADVLIGLDHPDDAAAIEVPAGKVLVQSVDGFRAIVDDPYLFGKIAANHALGDIFAMGAEAQTALALASVPVGIEAKVEDTLSQMLTGAVQVLSEVDCALIGGHTSEGAELFLGFAVNGLIDRTQMLRKHGMQPGEALILTKALGTGTLFAADMRQRARGRWIDAAIDGMLQSSRDAARALQASQASACTDVTGFGLLGHLLEMIRSSDVGVELELRAVPALDGALDALAAGFTSSLQPQNRHLERAIANRATGAGDPRLDLIFDPQTAGGLLASVPAERADACLAELVALGYRRAAVIGRVKSADDGSKPITLL